uniref:Uncharacterized protein n=1 Tax=Anguilla anguilla TaxID=7936 RepID=A0A0E9SM53_ANGAN
MTKMVKTCNCLKSFLMPFRVKTEHSLDHQLSTYDFLNLYYRVFFSSNQLFWNNLL